MKNKKSNSSVEELADNYISLVSILPCHIYWKDANGKYLGCNEVQAKNLGYSSPDDIIGKTDYDLPWHMNASALEEADQNVMMTKQSYTVEEEVILSDKKKHYFLSKKTALYAPNGTVRGIIGISFDITDRKKIESALEAEKEKAESTLKDLKQSQKQEERQRQEAEHLQQERVTNQLEAQEKFTKAANQVAHDIRAPLASLIMIVRACAEIPERERIALRGASNRISDIANNLLNHYREEQKTEGGNTAKPILLSATLLQILTEKRFQYNDYPVIFATEFSDNSHFSFINIDPTAFKRMISNIINNSVDAFENKDGKVVLKLDADSDWVFISVNDNGKGMPAPLIEKITNNLSVTEGKVDGNGIGLTQVRETLKTHSGNLSIQSKVGKGTEIRLQFPRIQAPAWIAEDITLYKDDLVIILDDDTSIHGAWDTCLEHFLVNTDITVTHFTKGEEALAHINSIPQGKHGRLILLTDYELLHQNVNGLDVVEQSGVKRSILVTSHYENIDIQKRATLVGTKILSKQLVAEVPINITSNSLQQEEVPLSLEEIEGIFLDDNKEFINSLKTYLLADKKIAYFHAPEEMRPMLFKYPKNVRIFLDNNFDNSIISGVEFAQELHNMGFQNITLVSGEKFTEGDLPSFLKVVSKEEIINVLDRW